MNNIKIDPVLKDAASVFTAHNKKVYLVGGAVRDMLLKKKSSDWDLATNATPKEVEKMFRHVIPTGIKHGTVTVLYKNTSLEVTTFRTEHNYTDGRHPDKIEYAATIEEDLSRRDFCMNAIAAELPLGNIIDPFNGKDDIKNKRIKCVGNAQMRFNEDGLRPLRALRFASQLGFELDDKLVSAIKTSLTVTAKVSLERIHDELEKIIASPNPLAAITKMEDTGMLLLILPELAACRNVMQKGYHKYDVLDHSLLALDYAAKNNYPQSVRLASLFHDIGKKEAAKLGDDGIWTFYNHETYSAEMCSNLMSRLKYPNNVRAEVVHLVKEHMFHYEDCWSEGAVRRFISRAGIEYLDKLFKLRMCDTFALAGINPPITLLLPLQKRIEAVLKKSNALSLKDLSVNGNDIMQLGNISGKQIGIILHYLLEAVLEDPALNTKGQLLEIAKAKLSNI
ncbi:MAG: HD domain-containing protein [Termitinemataceae bacterium]|nr:MAG: HD domain-containing protein [Termitinemataceae bacterium]